jgi:hypothetical protein
MAFEATACNVMIASPGDVQVERNIVREVVHEWNAVNASARSTVLLPVGLGDPLRTADGRFSTIYN